jgi:hypothetical protein
MHNPVSNGDFNRKKLFLKNCLEDGSVGSPEESDGGLLLTRGSGCLGWGLPVGFCGDPEPARIKVRGPSESL